MHATLPVIEHRHSNNTEGAFEVLTRDLDQVVEVIPFGSRFVEYGFQDIPWLRGFGAVRTRAPRLHDLIWGDRLTNQYAGRHLILFDFKHEPGGTSVIRYRVA